MTGRENGEAASALASTLLQQSKNIRARQPQVREIASLLKTVALIILFIGTGVSSDYSVAAPKFARTAGPWGTSANWSSSSCAIAVATTFPTNADDVTICNGVNIQVDGARTAQSLIIQSGSTNTALTFAGASSLTVTNDVTVDSPTNNNIVKQISVADQTLIVGGKLIINGGVTSGNAATSSSVSVGSGTITVAGNATVNGGSVRSTAQLTVGAGTLTIGTVPTPKTLSINAGTAANTITQVVLTPVAGVGTVTVNGDVTLTGGAATTQDALLNVNGASNAGTGVIITGNLSVNSPTVATSSTVSIAVAGGRISVGGNVTNQDTISVAGGILTASGAGATFATGSAVATLVSSTTVTSGTLAIAGNATVTGGAANPSGATMSVTTGVMTVGGTLGITAGSNTNTNATVSVTTGRISVAGSTTLTGGSVAGRNALLQAGGAPAVAGNGINVNGTLSTVPGAGGVATANVSITVANGVVNANGNFINNGTFTNNAVAGQLFLGGATSTINGSFIRATGTVTMDGAAPLAVTQTLSGTALSGVAANGFNNLTVNNTSGFGVTLGNAVAVKGTLVLTSGVIATGANTLDVTTALCAAPSVSQTGGWVNGNLQKRIPGGAASVCTFEVGGASAYTPVTATFVAAASAGNITAKSTDGDHANIGASGLDPSLTVNRFWSFTSTVNEAAFTAKFTFVAGDLDAGTSTAGLVGRRFVNPAWTTPGVGTRNALDTTLTGLTLTAITPADIVLGEAARASGSGSFNAVENLANAIIGKIFTKLAGVGFTLDIVALNSARTAIDTTFRGGVIVDLLDASDNTGALNATTGCRPVGAGAGNWHIIQTLSSNPQFLSSDSGRKQNVSITENNAWREVRLRITYPIAGPTLLTGCSNDNFSIRPASFTSITSNMTNTLTSGTPKAIAGAGTFDLTADTGLTGYTGTPKINNTAVQAHVNAKQNGSVTGSFPAASIGTSTGTGAFTYSEVGNFKFLGATSTAGVSSGVYDDTYTAVDGSSDCTADFSNVLSGGKYGCKFGLTTDTTFFGRFFPAKFVLTSGTMTNRRLAACATASPFTYAGEQFRVTFTLTAKNGAGATTQNYDAAAGFAALDPGTISNFGFGAIDSTAPTALTGNLDLSPLNSSSSGTWASGTVLVTSDISLIRAAAPNGPYELFKLGIAPVDADGVKLDVTTYDLDTSVPPDTNDRALVGAGKIRFGRLRLQNANGSELISMPIPIQTQYWNGSGFVTNAADNCTSVSGSVTTGNPQPLAFTIGAPTVGGTFSFGIGSLRLPAPGAGNRGSVDVTVDLTGAAKTYLQGAWSGATYTDNPSSRATFGTYRNSDKFIFQRENY